MTWCEALDGYDTKMFVIIKIMKRDLYEIWPSPVRRETTEGRGIRNQNTRTQCLRAHTSLDDLHLSILFGVSLALPFLHMRIFGADRAVHALAHVLGLRDADDGRDHIVGFVKYDDGG